MSPTATIVLIVVILLVLGAIAFGLQAMRRRRLQQTFGPEYDRVVADTGNRTEAERELHERTKRHAQLELKPLTAEARAKYSAAWEEVQIRFVDSPKEAVETADELVTRLITDRGYPTGDYDEHLANLSVEHAATLEHYRNAHEISARSKNDEAGTEDLRQALVHYRALFADLLGEDPVAGAGTAPAPRTATEDTTTTGVTTTTADRSVTENPAPDPGVAPSRPDATSR
jgi:Fe-S cluster assembly scaffold protein SufB